jgi:uncharacterized metal-binding protein
MSLSSECTALHGTILRTIFYITHVFLLVRYNINSSVTSVVTQDMDQQKTRPMKRQAFDTVSSHTIHLFSSQLCIYAMHWE